jgi:hypothetical protein
MPITVPIRRLLIALAAALLASAALIGSGVSAASAAEGNQKLMRLLDQCDKAAFDADPLFAGVCSIDSGSVTPARFAADLARGGNNNWWINNREETIKAGQQLVIRNDGGDLHTFTDVTATGYTKSCLDTVFAPPGGLPAPLQFSRAVAATDPAPTLSQCLSAFPADFVIPGAAAQPRSLAPGTHLIQCLIHPWMRTIVHVQA